MSLNEEICVLCCQEIYFYATGSCDHPVCYECSTRMRVLCEQNECPICRNDMPLVIFTHKKTLFSDAPKFKLCHEKYSIAFEDNNVEAAFVELLQHVCPVCGCNYTSFADLKTHVRVDHSLFYCELCVRNLKIFTFERKCYNRKDFAYHKRKGDPDNTSHRGHPLCEFCDERFLDYDELYRHLRREHYFCHFCDADGIKKTQFFPDYSFLRTHFVKEHYLCEEGDCAKEQFIAAFRSEIDFKAHKALNHTKNKSKAEVKQARTLDFEFPITRRKPASGNSSPNYRRNANREQEENRNDAAEDSQNSKQPQNKKFDTQCVEDFPLLANGSVAKPGEHFRESSLYANCISNDINITRKPAGHIPSRQKIQIDEFPSLDSAISQQKRNKVSSNTAASHMDTTSNGLSNQTGSSGLQKTMKWGKSIKENNNEKIASERTAQWSSKKAFSLEEFPELETKEAFTPNTAIQPQSSWQKHEAAPINLQSKDVAQQIYKKCKSKNKKNNITNVQNVPPNSKTEPAPLKKFYSGFNNYNAMDDEDASSNNLKLKIIDKIDKHRMKAEAEDIPWREEAKLVEDDFPPLGPPPTAAKAANRNSGFQPTNTSNKPSVPPGFSKKSTKPITNDFVSLSSIAQQLADVKDSVPLYSYNAPSDVQQRNERLIQQIYEFVEADNKLFNHFRSLSGNFRSSKITSAEYYSSCMDLFGKVRFLQMFPELLCLLPDIKKQQELLTVHNNLLSQDSKSKGAVPKGKGSKIDSVSSISVCQTCSQVILKKDFDSHTNSHKIQVSE